MQFIFHPTTRTDCTVMTAGNMCNNSARYGVDKMSVYDVEIALISYSTAAAGFGTEEPQLTDQAICLHHAAQSLQADHSSFRVTPNRDMMASA